jgi:hypothetical protein
MEIVTFINIKGERRVIGRKLAAPYFSALFPHSVLIPESGLLSFLISLLPHLFNLPQY